MIVLTNVVTLSYAALGNVIYAPTLCAVSLSTMFPQVKGVKPTLSSRPIRRGVVWNTPDVVGANLPGLRLAASVTMGE